jgi:hypothetical protein
MSKLSHILGVILISLFLGGCANSSINSYVEPTYNQGSINSLAMFPVRNAMLAPSEARLLNKDLSLEIQRKNPSLRIVAASQSLRLISEAGLASDWSNFVEDYYTSGIPDRVVLRKIEDALNVDAVFQGQLFNVAQVDAVPFGPHAYSRISIGFSILETKTAKTIWEASSDGSYTQPVKMSAPPIKKVLDLAMKKIKANMPVL